MSRQRDGGTDGSYSPALEFAQQNFENQPTLYRLPARSRVTMIYNGDNRRVRIQEP
ncbi:MAG: hypothetical protein JNM43_04595 [Planctomycetaceae bacterium]|jgi:hypothetical protein|nr:hypothetical protein [Planctomycetaceae bacterium]